MKLRFLYGEGERTVNCSYFTEIPYYALPDLVFFECSNEIDNDMQVHCDGQYLQVILNVFISNMFSDEKN